MSPVFKALQSRWEAAHRSPQSRLLKLALLRELSVHIHFKKSSSLATGHREEARLLEQLELQVMACQTLKTYPPSLLDLFEPEHPSPDLQEKPPLPRALFKWLEREKWDRFDRRWESAIATEALRAQWAIWSLETSISIRSVEKWDRMLRKKLWPKAIVLFMEFVGTQKAQWIGRWYIAAQPNIRVLKKLVTNPSREKKMKTSRIFG